MEKNFLDDLILRLKYKDYKGLKQNLDTIIQSLQICHENMIGIFCKDLLNISPENEKIGNLQTILKLVEESPLDLILIAQSLNGYSEKTDRIIEETMQKHSMDIAKFLFSTEKTRLFMMDKNDKIDEEGYSRVIERIMAEITKKQNLRLSDIESLQKGAYTRPYQFGNMILKVGLPPKTYNMPNSKYFLQPLVRLQLKSDNKVPFACIEVTSRTDTRFTYSEKTEEKLYNFWKKIRDEGKVWTDVRWENVGKLIQKNIPIHDGKPMYSSSNATGLDNCNLGEPLGPGELVVIDLDWVYYENDPNIKWPTNGFGKKFEDRYQNERQHKIEEEQDGR